MAARTRTGRRKERVWLGLARTWSEQWSGPWIKRRSGGKWEKRQRRQRDRSPSYMQKPIKETKGHIMSWHEMFLFVYICIWIPCQEFVSSPHQTFGVSSKTRGVMRSPRWNCEYNWCVVIWRAVMKHSNATVCRTLKLNCLYNYMYLSPVLVAGFVIHCQHWIMFRIHPHPYYTHQSCEVIVTA